MTAQLNGLLPCPNPWCRSTLVIRVSALDDETGQVCGEMRACASCGLAGPAGRDTDDGARLWNEREGISS